MIPPADPTRSSRGIQTGCSLIKLLMSLFKSEWDSPLEENKDAIPAFLDTLQIAGTEVKPTYDMHRSHLSSWHRLIAFSPNR